ncbi:MAG: DEAD/DEAH box helicase, partial [Verrucomicrobiales bacterium]|nr:DEAD/DEAH box helicase [Verrucomicrobiales bacterium]
MRFAEGYRVNEFERGRGLPIYDVRGELEAGMGCRERVRLVVEAPTGSGKSTQVPGMVLDGGFAGEKEVVVLQPRRIAARMLAKRVAWERGGKLGGEVGYQVRFEKHIGRETRIRYVTEGILLREMLSDDALSGIGAIVFDEFHERHLYGDITLARAVEMQETVRPDLKVVVMSATLETGALVEFLGEGCSVVRSEGRTYPVEVRYAPPKRGVDKTLPEQVVRACQDVLAGD